MRHALIALTGEMGYPSALTRADVGLLRRAVQGQAVQLRPAARQLRDGERAVQDLVSRRVPRPDGGRVRDAAASRSCATGSTRSTAIVIETQEPGVRIIDKTGPLANPADRDHCMQYMTAIPLIFGRLTAADYEDDVAATRASTRCARKMVVRENPTFTADYYDAGQALHRQRGAGVLQRTARPRSAWTSTIRSAIAERRAEGIPVLVKKVRSERRRALRARAVPSDQARCSPTARSSRRCRSTSSWRRW